MVQIGRGFAMGAADIVPGVSGGTVALLFGIYEKLVAEIRKGAGALARFIRLDVRGGVERLKTVDWVFLLGLLFGILLAVVLLIGWLRTQIDEHPVQVSAVFFGLVGASIVVARREVKSWTPIRLFVAAATAVLAFVLLGQRAGGIDDPSLLVVFVAGSIAICAMILPGISGSFILLMFGLYDHITAAVDDRDVTTIAAFGFGAVIGLASFSTLLHWVLRRYHDLVIAMLIGLMAGSLRVLWPWPSGDLGLDNVSLGQPVSGEVFGALIGCVVAASVVLAIGEMGSRRSTEI
jgi:putative membrane protein